MTIIKTLKNIIQKYITLLQIFTITSFTRMGKQNRKIMSISVMEALSTVRNNYFYDTYNNCHFGVCDDIYDSVVLNYEIFFFFTKGYNFFSSPIFTYKLGLKYI